MATCNIEDLTSQACLSGFFGQTPVTSLAIELQLIKNLSGDTSTLDELMAQACASGFVGHSPRSAKAIELQLWCDSSSGGSATSICVSGAGTTAANGTYVYVANGTPITVGTSGSSTTYYLINGGGYAILFDIDTWFLGVPNGVGSLYSLNTTSPIGTWTVNDGVAPAPITALC